MWRPIWSCFRWSLPCYELLLVVRCALTAPFHPYLIPLSLTKKRAIGGLLSAALVVGLRPQALPGTLLYEARTFLPFVSLPKDINKAATTQSAPRADCIAFSLRCLVRSHYRRKLALICTTDSPNGTNYYWSRFSKPHLYKAFFFTL